MMEGQFLIDQLVRRVSRELGLSPDPNVTLAQDEAMKILGELIQQPRAIFRNADDTIWELQNDDGTFPFLPGYDGPIEGLD